MSTLHHWVSVGLITPTLRGSEGKRVTRWWSVQDLVAARSIKALRESGCPLQTLRLAQGVLVERWEDSVGDAVLIWDGSDLLRIGEMGEVHSLIKHPGQGHFRLVALPVGHWRAATEDRGTEVDVAQFRKLKREREERRNKTANGLNILP